MWARLARLLRAAGHEVLTPSLTGIGERAHLATPETDLSTHILDVLNALRYEALSDVVLVGHSYGGMVVTGVADQPRTPQAQGMTDPDEIAWIAERRSSQPRQTFTQPISLAGRSAGPKVFVYSSGYSPSSF
jgi:predicted alpha/beta hydrolase